MRVRIALLMLGLVTSLTTTATLASQQVDQSDVVFKFDLRADGWKLLEDVSQIMTVQGFDLVPFLKKGKESWVNGDVMAARAVKLGANLGQHDAEYLLKNQHLIPEEYRGRYYLVFPGTKWRLADGNVSVPFLYWHGDRWVLDFVWFINNFESHARLVRPRK